MERPILRGRKVILRKRDYERDLEAYLQWLNDPEMSFWEEPWSEFRPPQREDFIKGWWEAQEKAGTDPHWQEGIWQIDALDGRYIGRITHSDISEPHRRCEVGIVIWAKDLWGKGYGTDAMMTLLHHLFQERKVHRVECATWSGNAGMIRCAEKSGFRREGVRREAVYNLRDGRYYDSVLFGILEREFELIGDPAGST